METATETIMRLAMTDQDQSDDTNLFAKFLLTIPAEDIAKAVREGTETGRRRSVLSELSDHGRRVPLHNCGHPPVFLLTERHTKVSGGDRLLETPEWCVIVTLLLRDAEGCRQCRKTFLKILDEDAIEMIGFIGNNDSGVSRLVRSFWRNFFHEAVRNQSGTERNRRLAEGALTLYKKARGSQFDLQREVGALLAEIIGMTYGEACDEIMDLLQKDRDFFEKENVVLVMNLLDYHDYHKALGH